MIKKVKKAINIYNTAGISAVSEMTKNYIWRRVNPSKANTYQDVEKDTGFLYEFITQQSLSSRRQGIVVDREGKKLKINWIIPDFLPGSGGHSAIFKIISYLEKKGIKSDIYMFGPLRVNNAAAIKQMINKHFSKVTADVFLNCENILSSDITIATSWPTAYVLNKVQNCKKKVYFIQDYEPFFYPRSAESIFAEQTYKMGFFHLCSSKWLSDKLKKEFKAKTAYFSYGYDKSYYPNQQNTKRDDRTVIFYGRWVTPRRGFELGVLALSEVYKRMPEVKIKIFGWDQDRTDLPFPYQNLGILSPLELGKLFRKATVGLSISLTNISIIPIEMLACGLPVVEVDNQTIVDNFKNKDEIMYSEPDPIKMAQNIINLLEDKSLQQRLSINGYKKNKLVHNFDKSLKEIEKIFLSLGEK